MTAEIACVTWLSLVVVVIGNAFLVDGLSPLPRNWTRATNLFALHSTDFSDPATLSIIESLPQALPGLDMIALQFMWQQKRFNSSRVEVFDNTPTTESLILATRAAHRAGLQVYYKPIVVGADGTQMFQLNPSNVTEWFTTYGSLLLDLAALAQVLCVEKLAIGVEELIIATDPANLVSWQNLIQSVRSVYNGSLTYGSNPLVNETQGVPFWDALDDIGVDLYIPMVNPWQGSAPLTPTVAEMTATYLYVLELKLMRWFVNSSFVAAGKHLFVSESGYPSSNMGLKAPWVLPSTKQGCTGNYSGNETAQAAAFHVQFSVLTSEEYAAYFNGFTQFWYGQPGTSDYVDREPVTLWSCGWTPVNKSATLRVLRDAYLRG